MADDRTDAEVLRRSQSDPEVFAALFDRHAEAVGQFLSRRLGSDVAEDLTVETFIVAFTRRTDFHPDRRSALPWLLGIATNLSRRHWRSERRMLRAYGRIRRFPPAGVDSDTVETQIILADALSRLPRREREPLLLHAWAGLAYSDIADALSLPLGTVKTRIRRGRTKLRELLGDEGAI